MRRDPTSTRGTISGTHDGIGFKVKPQDCIAKQCKNLQSELGDSGRFLALSSKMRSL